MRISLFGWGFYVLLITGLVSASCQFREGSGDVVIGPPSISLANGEIGYATLTVKNHLLLNDLQISVNNQVVGTVPKNGQQSFTLPVNAPPWGSGSGATQKTFDVVQYAENKCWDNQVGLQLSYSPGQAEIAAQQAAILAQQASQQKQTGEQQTGVLTVIGILILLAVVVGVVYISRQKRTKN
ncbi:LPXTG cell wall anchor domain-containing protein [Candidatus Micrarchaeota archaeon]|nr:LPXTG cell wall anchor domain-containing protein [Candidatus Micrarchaeota archaeon]